MAKNINSFVDNMQFSTTNLLTHLLHSENNEELNEIRHSPYISDDLNCQGLQAKFDYIKLLIDKFVHNNCLL